MVFAEAEFAVSLANGSILVPPTNVLELNVIKPVISTMSPAEAGLFNITVLAVAVEYSEASTVAPLITTVTNGGVY